MSCSSSSSAPEVERLRPLLACGELMHPYLDASYFHERSDAQSSLSSDDNSYRIANFTDLSGALASCCGVSGTDGAYYFGDNPSIHDSLVADINRRHIVFVLCDGMGTQILDDNLEDTAFLRRNNQDTRLRAVFPSTTPAALTTLATAKWPGQHGMPGWDLREQHGCEYPGEGRPIVQLRILAPQILNLRDHSPAKYPSFDDVFLAEPWARQLTNRDVGIGRRMLYINAYNGEDCPQSLPGDSSPGSSKASRPSDFSAWQIGKLGDSTSASAITDSLVATASIGNPPDRAIGTPEGAQEAVAYFREGIDKALRHIATAEAQGESSFVYLYTAHPDDHMHELGTGHSSIQSIVVGINKELERLWTVLGDRELLMAEYGGAGFIATSPSSSVNSSLVVTADHGHLTVKPSDMVLLPDVIVDMLDYANVGVLGKGRHAYLHCKDGLQSYVRQAWRESSELESFILLTIEEAIDFGLFGPSKAISPKIRPRMGDFVAVATTNCTLVTPNEYAEHSSQCLGAHGSLLPTEMKIPYIVCTHE